MLSPDETQILQALRRITRAIDLHSRHLASAHGLTGPQLMSLRAVRAGATTPSALAEAITLSQGTVTGILDRLVDHGLLTRERDTVDRRKVILALTAAGEAALTKAPPPLQAKFRSRLATLRSDERKQIREVLEKIVEMMGAEDLDAAPVLVPGPIIVSSEEAPQGSEEPTPTALHAQPLSKG